MGKRHGGGVGSREEAIVMIQGTQGYTRSVRTVEAGRSGQDNGSILKVESTNLDTEFAKKKGIKAVIPRF